jgi:hypothetical protein
MKILTLLILALFNAPEKLIAQPELNSATYTPAVNYISLIQLMANPEKYHGKVIQVVGYLNIEFESSALFLHKEDFDNSILKNGFWVRISNDFLQGKELAGYNKNYVILMGTFNMQSKGHMSLFSGEIKDITRLDFWKSNR